MGDPRGNIFLSVKVDISAGTGSQSNSNVRDVLLKRGTMMFFSEKMARQISDA